MDKVERLRNGTLTPAEMFDLAERVVGTLKALDEVPSPYEAQWGEHRPMERIREIWKEWRTKPCYQSTLKS